MVISFLITIFLYWIAYYIFSHIKKFSDDDYKHGKHSWDKSIKEGAEPKRFKLQLWILIVGILCFFVPFINIITGIVLIVLALILLDDKEAKFYPGKLLNSIINLFTKEL